MILPRFLLMVLRMKSKFLLRVLEGLLLLGPYLLPDSPCILLFDGHTPARLIFFQCLSASNVALPQSLSKCYSLGIRCSSTLSGVSSNVKSSDNFFLT